MGLLLTAMLGAGLGYGWFVYPRLIPTAPATRAAPAKAPVAKEPPSNATLAGDGGEAHRWLLGGNAQFKEGINWQVDLSAQRRRSLLNEQRPYCTILTCADSRVPPEHIFRAGLGDIFTVRVAGNVADPFTLGSIEYAVDYLGTKLVVVMGHEGCGAVKAAMSKKSLGPNLDALMSLIRPGIAGIVDLDEAVRKNIHQQVAALGESEDLQARQVKGELSIMAAYYDLDSGAVEWLETANVAGVKEPEAKPLEVKPADVKPVEVKPAGAVPVEAKPAAGNRAH